jgi:formylglycine-generating enzyme required for sulfatase activity
MMGSPDDDKDADPDEKSQHKVRITKPFYLGIYEVTQAQYKAVMGNNLSGFSPTGGGSDKVAGQSTGQHPVENVSWQDAVTFCNKPSAREDRKPFYKIDGNEVRVPDWNGPGYRLPTEAEWEYACRAHASTLRATRSETIQRNWENMDGYGVIPRVEPTRSVRNGRTSSGCMTSTATSWSGAGIGTTRALTNNHARLIRLGRRRPRTG